LKSELNLKEKELTKSNEDRKMLLKRVTEIKATSFIPTTSKTDNVNISVLT